MRNALPVSRRRHIGFTLGCWLLAAGSGPPLEKEPSRVVPGASWEQREPAQLGMNAALLERPGHAGWAGAGV